MLIRRLLAVAGVCAVAALIAGGLALAGSGLPPPRFVLGNDGLLTPQDYPAWRRASDWLAGRKYIMLTFDDGPGAPGVDKEILAILAKHDAHAVFFEVCAHIDAATANVPNLILASGSLLGNHTYNHMLLPKLGPAALQHQIDGCNAKLETLTGQQPTLFRPPWGQMSPGADELVRAAGMRVVQWDVNSGDTWLKSPPDITALGLREASYGGHVLLMHSYPKTAKALGPLLTGLQRRGFQFALPSP